MPRIAQGNFPGVVGRAGIDNNDFVRDFSDTVQTAWQDSLLYRCILCGERGLRENFSAVIVEKLLMCYDKNIRLVPDRKQKDVRGHYPDELFAGRNPVRHLAAGRDVCSRRAAYFSGS